MALLPRYKTIKTQTKLQVKKKIELITVIIPHPRYYFCELCCKLGTSLCAFDAFATGVAFDAEAAFVVEETFKFGRTISGSSFLFLKRIQQNITNFKQSNFQAEFDTKAQTVPLGVPICLRWFSVNNRWFSKMVYLRDQPVNLRTYCACQFF